MSSETQTPLASREAFAAYVERVKRQLDSHLLERIAFLESAVIQLNALQALARQSGNTALVTELTDLASQAEFEAATLRSTEQSHSPLPDEGLFPAGTHQRQ